MSEKCCGAPRLLTWYRQYLEDGKSAAFVSIVAGRYSVACLQRLTVSSNVEIRRAAVLALGMVAGREAIPSVGRCLRDSDRCVRLVSEAAFLDLTRREMGSHAAHQLDKAKRDLDGGRYERSLDLLTRILEVWPSYSDAWYQRAVANYCLNKLNAAYKDARQATRFNEFHFLAYALRGRCLLELNRPLPALKIFTKSLEVYPTQILVRGYIEVLLKQNRRG